MDRLVFVLSVFIVLVPSASTSTDSRPETRKAEYLELREMIGAEHFEEAMARCKDLLERYPEYLYLYQTIAEIALYARDFDNTITYLNNKIEYGPNPALSYFALGSVYFYRRDYRSAVIQLNNAIELGLEAPECFNVFEKAYEKLKGVDGAIRFFNTLCHRNPENPNYWYALALAYWKKQDGKRIIECLEKALALMPYQVKYLEAKKCAFAWWRLKSNENDGLTLLLKDAEQRGDVEGVLFLLFYKSISPNSILDVKILVMLARKYGNFRWLGLGLTCLSLNKHISCEYDSAIYLAAQALASSGRALDDAGIGIALSFQFGSQIENGDLDGALRSAEHRYAYFDSSKNTREVTLALVDLARAYHEMNADTDALEYAIEALNRSEILGSDPRQLCEIHLVLGMIYSGLGNSSEGLQHQRAALEYVSSDNPAQSLLPLIEREMGRNLLDLGQFAESRIHLNTSVRLATATGLNHEAACSLVDIGQFFLRTNQLDSACIFFEKSLTTHGHCKTRKIEITSGRGLGQVAEIKGDFEGALKWYQKIIDLETSRNASFISPMLIDDLRNATSLLCRLGRIHEAATTWNSRRVLMLGGISSFLETYRLSKPDSKAKHYSIVSPGANRPGSWGLTPVFDRLSKETALPHISNEAILDYCVARKSTECFCYLPDTILHFSISKPKEDLRDKVFAFSKVIPRVENSELVLNPLMANFSTYVGKELYGLLVKPIEAFSNQISRLIVVPDDVLGQLPFCALVTSIDTIQTRDITAAHFLIERFEVSYIDNSGPDVRSGSPYFASHTRTLLAIGNPSVTYTTPGEEKILPISVEPYIPQFDMSLPGAEREVNTLKQTFGDDVTALLGERASVDAFKLLAPQYRIIHLATHARFDNVRPLYSTLYLSAPGGEERSGALRAFELLDLDLQAELVVLSACNTGRTNTAQGLSGFQSAFLFAGARSVVSTLWSVEDKATSQFMEKFYYHLRNGERKSRALQLAQLYLIAHGKADPFYWGAFTLTGDSSPIVFQSTSNNRMVFIQAFGGAGIFIVILLLLRALLSIHPFQLLRRRTHQDSGRRGPWQIL